MCGGCWAPSSEPPGLPRREDGGGEPRRSPGSSLTRVGPTRRMGAEGGVRRGCCAMHQDRPFALHITWTCYTTWLPGDRRGYVSNTLLPEGGSLPRQNMPGTPVTADDPLTRER